MKRGTSKTAHINRKTVPDNLDQVAKLDDFVHDILKAKLNQKDLDMDVTFEECLCDGPSFEVVDVSRRGT